MAVAAQDAVHLHQVRFGYPSSSPVLSVDNLRIAAGESVFLSGASGSGKTTLLSLITGVLTPQQGTVQVLGHAMSSLAPSARDTMRGSEIGYIFQRFTLVPYLSVAENIALPCLLHPQRRARIAAPTLDEEIGRLAERLDLRIPLDQRVTKLSAGQQQRVSIARALIGSPPLVIADEPTSSLDTDRRDAFLRLLTESVQESASATGRPATLLFVSHDRSLARHFDRVLSIAEINRVDGAA